MSIGAITGQPSAADIDAAPAYPTFHAAIRPLLARSRLLWQADWHARRAPYVPPSPPRDNAYSKASAALQAQEA